MASGTRTNSAWQPSIVLPNFQPRIALKPCFSLGPSGLRHVAARRDSAGDNLCPSRKPVTDDPSFLDDAHRLVTDRQPRRNQILAFENMDVGAAIVVIVTRMSASGEPMSGIGFSSSTIRPDLTKTAASFFAFLYLTFTPKGRTPSIALVTPACRETYGEERDDICGRPT